MEIEKVGFEKLTKFERGAMWNKNPFSAEPDEVGFVVHVCVIIVADQEPPPRLIPTLTPFYIPWDPPP